MKIAILLLAIPFTGCCSGVDPKSVSYSAAPLQAVGPQQSYGVRPEVRSALMLPPNVLKCLTNGAAKILGDVADTGVCVFENIVPPAVVPVQAVPLKAATPCVEAAPLRAPAPPASAKAPCEPVACNSGACASR